MLDRELEAAVQSVNGNKNDTLDRRKWFAKLYSDGILVTQEDAVYLSEEGRRIKRLSKKLSKRKK